MAKRGRKPKPIAEQKRRGNPGKKKIGPAAKVSENQNTDMPAVMRGKDLPVKAPEYLRLSDEAAMIWNRVTEYMSVKRYYEISDENMLARYCAFNAWFLVIQKQIDETKIFVEKTESKFVTMDRKSALVAVAIDIHKQMMSVEKEFAFSPVSRNHLESDFAAKGNNPNLRQGSLGLPDPAKNNHTVQVTGALSPATLNKTQH